mgnify:CR=1 FL=1
MSDVEIGCALSVGLLFLCGHVLTLIPVIFYTKEMFRYTVRQEIVAHVKRADVHKVLVPGLQANALLIMVSMIFQWKLMAGVCFANLVVNVLVTLWIRRQPS